MATESDINGYMAVLQETIREAASREGDEAVIIAAAGLELVRGLLVDISRIADALQGIAGLYAEANGAKYEP